RALQGPRSRSGARRRLQGCLGTEPRALPCALGIVPGPLNPVISRDTRRAQSDTQDRSRPSAINAAVRRQHARHRFRGALSHGGVIDRFLEVFTSYIDSGFGLLSTEVGFLSSTLVAIDITLAGLFWALASDEDVIARLIRKTLYVGFFAFLIGNFNTLAKVIF